MSIPKLIDIKIKKQYIQTEISLAYVKMWLQIICKIALYSAQIMMLNTPGKLSCLSRHALFSQDVNKK